MKNIYLAKKDGGVIIHADKQAMFDLDGIAEPDMTVTEEEFYAADGLVRVIDGVIVLGKTEEEKQAEERQKQIAEIDALLVDLDRKYLTPRILAGIAEGDGYAIGQKEQHELLAEPLRQERRNLQTKV